MTVFLILKIIFPEKMWQQLAEKIIKGDVKALARGMSLIENETKGYEELMQLLPGWAQGKNDWCNRATRSRQKHISGCIDRHTD